MKDGKEIEAGSVVLSIGLQGNPRRLGVEGEDSGIVQYTLDDPDGYQGETIIIVGAGDAAIENAVALARNNTVIIVNRRDEFARAKEGNLTLIARAIDDGTISCFYNTNAASIDSGNGAGGAENWLATHYNAPEVTHADNLAAGMYPAKRLPTEPVYACPATWAHAVNLQPIALWQPAIRVLLSNSIRLPSSGVPLDDNRIIEMTVITANARTRRVPVLHGQRDCWRKDDSDLNS